MAHVRQELALGGGRVAGDLLLQSFVLALLLNLVALAPLGHIHEGALKVAGLAVLGIDGPDGDIGPAFLALTGLEGAFNPVYFALLLQLPDHPVADTRLGEAGPQRIRNTIDQAFDGTVAQNPRHGGIGVQEPAAGRHLEDPFHGILEQSAVAVKIGHRLLVPLQGLALDDLDAVGERQ